MRYLRTYENWEEDYKKAFNDYCLRCDQVEINRKRFERGKNAYSLAFHKMYKIIDATDTTIWVEDEDGHQAEFLIKDFIPEIEYTAKKYNL